MKKRHSKLSKNEPVCLCKEGLCVGLGQECGWWGQGNCLKYHKKRWNRKDGRGNKIFKKGEGKLGKGVGALKMGAGTPLQTMSLSW